ncbi:hypothetical protein CkaCkLH20_13064 [Colletotrichum karsti]|uniref:F-box domain-containing protein n=1 Tax=Colletotrichum karsti TaxID=1095194 RepID=A0A9P6HTM7_9PEZI|nr:uncharacterized protein CkaCkLH20_13064 [Colletotrichum karsti]KAF9869467.1 hypothetical protein CkaCkLH20_13064 [Colletotrichum karsti]
MTSTSSEFLDIPIEIRLEIYSHLLLCPPLDKLAPDTRPVQRLHPAILKVNRQIHDEASPILYCKNIFLAHETLLASFPRLRPWYPPVKERSVLPRIRRFHIRVRLDCDPGYNAEAATAAFSGADQLVIEVRQSMFLGADHEVMQLFEGVRRVKVVKIYGSTTGFEDYARWLEDVMQSDADDVDNVETRLASFRGNHQV